MSDKTKSTPVIETKFVRHDFTDSERIEIGGILARAHATARGIEAEFDQVKASFKAKTSEAESKVEKLSTDLMNGFEMRNKDCRVEFRPKEKVKVFFLADAPPDAEPILTEPMTAGDFEQDLIAKEAQFECREEIPIFPSTDTDHGYIVVGRQRGRWFTALRILIGKQSITQHLDSEQKSVKQRCDAVKEAGKTALNWLDKSLGREAARGFMESIDAAVQGQKEREE